MQEETSGVNPSNFEKQHAREETLQQTEEGVVGGKEKKKNKTNAQNKRVGSSFDIVSPMAAKLPAPFSWNVFDYMLKDWFESWFRHQMQCSKHCLACGTDSVCFVPSG